MYACVICVCVHMYTCAICVCTYTYICVICVYVHVYSCVHGTKHLWKSKDNTRRGQVALYTTWFLEIKFR